ncbi:MAG: SCO family protein [Limisphaerales bacterium]
MDETKIQKNSRTIEWWIWGGLVLVMAGIAATFIFSKCRERPKSENPVPSYGKISEFTLTNQLGKAISLSDLRGHIGIADVIFTRCPLQCIKMTKGMAELQTALVNEKSVQLISLTADPGFDTPPILKKYGERFNADPERWFFLTGPKHDVYSLALNGLKLAIAEKKPDERESLDDLFIHSTKMVLIDEQGRVRGWFDGENPATKDEILHTVRKLLRKN